MIWPTLKASAEICQKFRLIFRQWSLKKNCFWDLLTFKRPVQVLRTVLWTCHIICCQSTDFWGTFSKNPHLELPTCNSEHFFWTIWSDVRKSIFQNGIEFSIKFFTPLEPCKPNGQEGDLWVICIRTKYAWILFR